METKTKLQLALDVLSGTGTPETRKELANPNSEASKLLDGLGFIVGEALKVDLLALAPDDPQWQELVRAIEACRQVQRSNESRISHKQDIEPIKTAMDFHADWSRESSGRSRSRGHGVVATGGSSAVAVAVATQHGSRIPHDKIAKRAYEKWCQRGQPPGTDKQDWLEAETELRAEQSRSSGSSPQRRM